MATWKRLTEHGASRKIDVNMELVAFIRPLPTHTELHLANKVLGVIETPDAIHNADALLIGSGIT